MKCLEKRATRIRPLGYGMGGVASPRGTFHVVGGESRPVRINQTVPYGTGRFGRFFQAFHARLPSNRPYGTTCNNSTASPSCRRQVPSPTNLFEQSYPVRLFSGQPANSDGSEFFGIDPLN
jgi:hypothetical protein